MIRIGKSTEYALMGLMHLMENPRGQASAREIAQAHGLPLPLLSKILKCLQNNGLMHSSRGARGGYRLARDLGEVSLEQLLRMLKGVDLGGRRTRLKAGTTMDRVDLRPSEPPLLALQAKMQRLLQEIKLSDLITPGRRIDVPVELIGFRSRTNAVNNT